jgi:hypothetical protein
MSLMIYFTPKLPKKSSSTGGLGGVAVALAALPADLGAGGILLGEAARVPERPADE